MKSIWGISANKSVPAYATPHVNSAAANCCKTQPLLRAPVFCLLLVPSTHELLQSDKPVTAAWLSSKLQHRSHSAAMQEPDLMMVSAQQSVTSLLAALQVLQVKQQFGRAHYQLATFEFKVSSSMAAWWCLPACLQKHALYTLITSQLEHTLVFGTGNAPHVWPMPSLGSSQP